MIDIKIIVGEEYGIVVKTEGTKKTISCVCVDGKTRVCTKTDMFDAHFKRLLRVQ